MTRHAQASAFAGVPLDAARFHELGQGRLPGWLGMQVDSMQPHEVRLSMAIAPHHTAPNGFLHAGALVSLADTACGYGCVANLPASASGFTTLELKSNHVGTALQGHVDCVATPVHVGRTTQVWDAVVTHRETARKLMVFRCSQMVLYPSKSEP